MLLREDRSLYPIPRGINTKGRSSAMAHKLQRSTTRRPTSDDKKSSTKINQSCPWRIIQYPTETTIQSVQYYTSDLGQTQSRFFSSLPCRSRYFRQDGCAPGRGDPPVNALRWRKMLGESHATASSDGETSEESVLTTGKHLEPRLIRSHGARGIRL